MAEKAINSESQSYLKVSCFLFRIVLSNQEKCLTIVYWGSPNIEIFKNCSNLKKNGIGRNFDHLEINAQEP